MRRGEFALLDSMNLWIDITSAELSAVMQRCDALILNEDELRQFTGMDDLVTGASSLITAPGEPGPSMFMVKRGSSGSVLVHPEGNAWLGAVQGLDLVDPRGAGMPSPQGGALRSATYAAVMCRIWNESSKR